MSFKEIWNRQSYAGGTPSAAELLVWSYRYHHAKAQFSIQRNTDNAVESLRRARADAAAVKTRYLSSLPAGYGTSGKPFAAYGSKHMRWIESPATAGLRFVDYADKLAELGHTGWYLQNGDYTESVRGVVYSMAARDGAERFVGGYADPYNDGPVCLDFSDIRDSDRDAARAADHIAERMAKETREYEAAYQAGARWADLGTEIESSRATVKALLAERKAARSAKLLTYPTICAAIRTAVRNALGDIENARQERAKLKDGEWLNEYFPGFFTGDQRLVDAFNEGAGITA